MARVLCVVCVALSTAAAIGCDSTPTDLTPSPGAPGRHRVEGQAGGRHGADQTTPEERRAPPPARFGRLTAPATLEGGPARVGQELEAEQTVVVGPGGQAAVQLREGGRIVLEEGSTGRVLAEGSAQMLLLSGTAHILQPPSGNSPRPPLRIVTPTATLEIGRSGETYLALLPNGSCWVAVLSGETAVSTGESDNRRRLVELVLHAGQAVAIAGRPAEPTEGPARLTDAIEMGQLLATGLPPVDDAVLHRDLSHELERLDGALRWLETESRRGRELTTAHRSAAQEGADNRQEIQRSLVDHSRALYRLRRLATARWERARAKTLQLTLLGAAPSQDPIEERRPRATGLLGF